jgi:hypothetical protein
VFIPLASLLLFTKEGLLVAAPVLYPVRGAQHLTGLTQTLEFVVER